MADSSNVVPFGKYKGQPVEVLRRDAAYVDWCMMQGIHHQYPMAFGLNVTVNPLLMLQEPTETPEHNRYQAMFLDEDFAGDVYRGAKGYDERESHLDISFEAGIPAYWRSRISKAGHQAGGLADVQLCSRLSHDFPARIEIKPVMGDDYPVVLRQMQSNFCNVLYLVSYTGRGATLDQVRQIFASSSPVSIKILMDSDFWED